MIRAIDQYVYPSCSGSWSRHLGHAGSPWYTLAARGCKPYQKAGVWQTGVCPCARAHTRELVGANPLAAALRLSLRRQGAFSRSFSLRRIGQLQLRIHIGSYT